jgi:hypothetical protein
MPHASASVAIYSSAWSASSQKHATMAKAMSMADYDYLERDGAYFRRRSGKATGSVDDVLHGDKWVPYEGDALEAGAWGATRAKIR